MRSHALIALASLGVVALTIPCAAQTADSGRTAIRFRGEEADAPVARAVAAATGRGRGRRHSARHPPAAAGDACRRAAHRGEVRDLRHHAPAGADDACGADTGAARRVLLARSADGLDLQLSQPQDPIARAGRGTRHADFGLFTDEEKAAFCTGFIAGVLGANPKDGPTLVAKMLPMPDKDQAVMIRAIAYSGRPDWRELLDQVQGSACRCASR